MNTDAPVPAVDQNGLPFDVWLVPAGEGLIWLRDSEGNLYAPFPEADDPDGLGFADVSDPEDVILVGRIWYHDRAGTRAVLRVYKHFVLWTDGSIRDPAAPREPTGPLSAADEEPGETRSLVEAFAAHDQAIHWAKVIRDRNAPLAPCSDDCCSSTRCTGWDVFDGRAIQRDDECGKYADDLDAVWDVVRFYDEHAQKAEGAAA